MSKKVKKQEYTRLATLPIWGGLAWIESQLDEPMKAKRTNVKGFDVHLTSLRLRTFATKGTRCKCCGLEASFFAIEHQPHSNSAWPHMNMYGVNEAGEEVLFTKDHIQTKKEGGLDTLENMQTMCRPCNGLKGSRSDVIS